MHRGHALLLLVVLCLTYCLGYLCVAVNRALTTKLAATRFRPVPCRVPSTTRHKSHVKFVIQGGGNNQLKMHMALLGALHAPT